MNHDLERLILDYLSEETYVPLKPGILARHLHFTGPQRKAFRETVEDLLAAGRVREDKRGRLMTQAVQGTVVGTIKKVAAGGAYLIPHPDRVGPPMGDVFVPPEDLRDAHTGDEVLIRLSKRRGPGDKRFGRVEEILTRATASFVGTYDEHHDRAYVKIDGTGFEAPVPVGDPGAKGAEPGDKVVVEMLRFPTHNRPGEAVLTKVLGPAGEPEVDTLSIIHEFGLPDEFPPDVLDEVHAVAEVWDEENLQGRLDLTGTTIVTIDPVDARDFDDAISLTRSDDGHWHLGVHVADVAHFVRAGGPLDTEAKRRGTSVYLPGRVIPMLPELLSNGLASLQAGQVRFTKSVFIEFDPDGIALHTRFADSAIRVAHRFAYEEVMPVVRDAASRPDLPPEIVTLLGEMHALAMILRGRRFERGAIELDLAETKIAVDRGGRVTGVHTAEHDESHQIIEEFMLAANVGVATALHDRHTPFLRRTHGDPDEEKLRLFAEFVATLGHPIKHVQSRPELQKLVRSVRGLAAQHPVNYALLRSFKQAEYSAVEEGHYALAEPHYCHFTSPIRRYPDLTVHRLIGQVAAGKKRPGGPSPDELFGLAKRCSDASRRAEAAERELVRLKLLRYMVDRVGEELPAVITGVERFGVFCRGVELPVEGLIHVTALGAATKEMFDFDEAAHAMVGRTTGTTYQLGRPIRVKVGRVDVEARKLDFIPADDESTPPPAKPAPARHWPPAFPKESSKKNARPRQPGRRKRGR